MSTTKPITGGEFLIRESSSSDIFIPEELSEELLMVRNSDIADSTEICLSK